MKRNEVFFIAFLLIAFLALLWQVQANILNKAESVPEGLLGREMATVQDNSLIAISSVYYPSVIINSDLIECLIEKESDGNPAAIGKAGEISILQFMPQTFYEFCVLRYKYRNDIWDTEIQKLCADRMIEEGYAYKWTTFKYCE